MTVSIYFDCFETKHRYMVDWYHKPKCQPKCLEKRLDYCVQGQGHREGSKFKLIFLQTVSSKLLRLLQLECLLTTSCYRGQFTIRAHVTCELLILLRTKLLILLMVAEMYFCWSLYLLACQVRVTVGDSTLRCCVSVTSFKLFHIIIITTTTKAQILRKPRVLYKEHDGRRVLVM